MTTVLNACRDRGVAWEAVARAAEVIRSGGVVAYPTETVYGLGALALREAALEEIYGLKQRPRHKPVSILIEGPEELAGLVQTIPTSARALMARFWPGPLTLLFLAAEHLPSVVTGAGGKLGVRVSSHPVARELVRAVGAPITATSANRSGAPSCRTGDEVLRQLGGRLEFILDGGLTPGSEGSTIADVTVAPPKILRVGAIAADEVLRCWRQGAALR
ncbi:MAG TPA: L-threonylcarbamoyladenylate synthase [Syntrophobacteria bacterium]|nr:L-threonylcarbamoyladenylate synthase [Syntrophobacteria bacterium]